MTNCDGAVSGTPVGAEPSLALIYQALILIWSGVPNLKSDPFC